MKQISELLKRVERPKVILFTKKQCISIIAQMVKFDSDPLKNWKIIARRIAPLSSQEASRAIETIKAGTWNDTTDYKGAFLNMCKDIKYPKKPKQSKLFK